MIKRGTWWFTTAVVLIALFWKIHLQNQEIIALTKELARTNSDRSHADDNARRKEKEIAQLTAHVTEMETRLDAGLREKNPFEQAFQVWTGNALKLFGYLTLHPERRIPQMEALTAADWLAVAKDGEFETEADVREALGKLRGVARNKFRADIGKALSQAVSSSNGVVPSEVQALAPYLPAGFNPEILQQLKIDPSGLNPGVRLSELIRDDYGKFVATPVKFFLMDIPVDIWDSTIAYKSDGTSASRTAEADGKDSVATAIAQFTQSNGTPPNNVSQLMQYHGIDAIDQSVLKDLFSALTTKPNL